MKKKNLTLYDLLYGIIILLALGIRLVFVNQWSLSEKEAALVVNIANDPNSLFQVWTGFLFNFFKESEFFARLLPILFGTGLVLLPSMLRKYVGEKVSLIMAVGFALDPGLIAFSKQAGPEIIAITSLLAFVIFLYEKKWIPAGIFLGIGLLSGYQFWVGAIALFLCAGFTLLFASKPDEDENVNEVVGFLHHIFTAVDWKKFATSLGLTIILGGTLFLTQTKGLAGIASGIVDFFVRENPGFYGMPIIPILIGLCTAYAGLLIFSLIGSWKIPTSWREFIWFWVLIVFIMVSVFPSRQLADYVWMVIPLYYPAAKLLSGLTLKSDENKWIVFGSALALSMLIVFSIYSLMHFLDAIPTAVENEEAMKYLLTSIVALVVFIAVIFIIGWGWSYYLSHDMLLYILIGGLLIMYFVPAMRSTGFGAKPQNLMWIRTSYFEDADLFRKTITILDQNRSVKKETLLVQLHDVDSNSLRWELRNYDLFVQSQNVITNETTLPDVIISSMESAPQVTENRTGQDMICSRMPGWSIMTNLEYFYWAMDEEPLYNDQFCIVWASLYEGSLDVVNDAVGEEVPIIE